MKQYARAEHLLSSNSIKKITNWLVKIKEGVADLGELACHRGGFGAQISGRASDKSKTATVSLKLMSEISRKLLRRSRSSD
ncbi:hypothetical protein ACOSQ3_015842 [Xanthoceras sorbifolium]